MKLKFNSSYMVKHHCAEGRCTHPIYQNFILCRKHSELCKSGRNPTQCFYYNRSLDYK